MMCRIVDVGWTAEGLCAGMYVDIKMWLSTVGTFGGTRTASTRTRYVWMDTDDAIAH